MQPAMAVCAHDVLHRHAEGDEHSHPHVHAVTFCELPSWDDFVVHLLLCTGCFVVLLSTNVGISMCKFGQTSEKLGRALRSVVAEFFEGRLYLLLACAQALFMCVLHVSRVESADDYGNINDLWNVVETYSCMVQAVECLLVWLFSALTAPGLSNKPVGRFLMDCFLVPSVLYRGLSGSQRSHMSFSYVAVVRFAFVWNLLQRSLPLYQQGVRLQSLNACIILGAFVFCAAMLVLQVETLTGDPWPIGLSAHEASTPVQRWNIWSSCYFVAGIVTTMGGDLWPKSALGQLVAVISGIFGIYLVLDKAVHTWGIVRLAMDGAGEYTIRSTRRHVVVSGSPSFQVLRDFIGELYHEDHMLEADDLDLVILLPQGLKSTIDSFKRFLRLPENRQIMHRIHVLQGSVLKPRDLRRAGYKSATMAWLLPNLYAGDADHEDVESAMRALAMRNFAPYVRVIALTMKADARTLFTSVGLPDADVIGVDEFKLGLLGKSCQVQGFISWASILLKNTGSQLPSVWRNSMTKPPWVTEYFGGLANEVYEVDLSQAYRGAPFGAIAADVLARSDGNAFLIGVVEEATFPSDRTVTRLFPGRSEPVGAADDRLAKGIFVAPCREVIEQHPPEGRLSWTLDTALPAAAMEAAKGLTSLGLPNVVPEPLAAAGRQGFVRQQWEISDDAEERTAKLMSNAASKLTATGLRSKARLADWEARALAGDSGGGDESAFAASGGGADVAAKLLDQQREAERQAERAAEQVKIDAEVADEKRLAGIFGRVMSAVEREQELEWKSRSMQPDEQAVDDELWGGPAPRPPSLFSNPREPPAQLLVRGGHIVVVALCGAEAEHAVESEAAPRAVRPPGRRLGLVYFLRALRAGVMPHKVPKVVVLSNEVPGDWPLVADDDGIFFVPAPPVSGAGLRRAGVQQASAVVIYQRTASITQDPSTVDSEVVFACRLVESLISAAERDVPVFCDLILERNAFFVPHLQRRKRGNKFLPVRTTEASSAAADADDEDEDQARPKQEQVVTKEDDLPFYMQERFANGQLFVSSVITSMAANMMYNPATASIFQEMLKSGYAIVPVPDSWTGKEFESLFSFMLRKRNLLPVALLRRLNFDAEQLEIDDDEEEGRQEEGEKKPPERWSPADGPSERCVIVMPPGGRLVAEHDGVLCLLPATGGGVLVEPFTTPADT